MVQNNVILDLKQIYLSAISVYKTYLVFATQTSCYNVIKSKIYIVPTYLNMNV